MKFELDEEVGFYEQRLLVVVIFAIVAFTLAVASGDFLQPLQHVREVLGTAAAAAGR